MDFNDIDKYVENCTDNSSPIDDSTIDAVLSILDEVDAIPLRSSLVHVGTLNGSNSANEVKDVLDKLDVEYYDYEVQAFNEQETSDDN